LAWSPFDAEGTVAMLFIDDGIPDRGHRKAIFGDFHQAGVSSCGSVTVWNFAKKFRLNDEIAASADADWKIDCSTAFSNSNSLAGNGKDHGLTNSAGGSNSNRTTGDYTGAFATEDDDDTAAGDTDFDGAGTVTDAATTDGVTPFRGKMSNVVGTLPADSKTVTDNFSGEAGSGAGINIIHNYYLTP